MKELRKGGITQPTPLDTLSDRLVISMDEPHSNYRIQGFTVLYTREAA